MEFGRAIWSQTALEHANERLRVLENEIRKAVREDKARLVFQQRQDLIPSLPLYTLLEKRAGAWVATAHEIYCSTWKEQGREKSRDFCIAVFQLGILPFIRNNVLNLLCYALATAQPALKTNTGMKYSRDSSELQPGARLAGVRRIVDSLQNHWSWQVMSVDANESPASSILNAQFAPSGLIDPKIQISCAKRSPRGIELHMSA
jgi:hypothetical protein